MTEQQAKLLLQKYYSGLCNPEEEKIVTNWLDAMGADIHELKKEDQSAIKKIISQKIYEQTGILLENDVAPTNKVIQLNSNYLGKTLKWIVAATLTLVIAGSIFFLYQNKSHIKNNPQAATQPAINDLAPGGNVAILTLSDGKQIVLDSNSNGLISNQSNISIRKLADGRIAYTQHASGNNIPSGALKFNTLEVPKGGQYQLILSDGSIVWLNAASKLKFPEVFIGNTRKVELEGEAYFEVKHHAAQPFLVQAGSQLIEDLGTEFNVNAYSNEANIKTTLVKGIVKLGTIILKPGEQAVTKNNGSIRLEKDVDIEEVIAWKNGDFRFQSATMPEIMRQVERWYKADVIYDGNIEGTFSGGISRNVNLSQLLHILELTRRVQFSLNGHQLIVKPLKL